MPFVVGRRAACSPSDRPLARWRSADDPAAPTKQGTMTTFEELDQLSSRELHDRAIRTAERHADVKFLWKLLEAAPAAKAVAGEEREGENDVAHWSSQVADAFGGHDDAVLDALRPLYIEELLKHPDA